MLNVKHSENSEKYKEESKIILLNDYYTSACKITVTS